MTQKMLEVSKYRFIISRN